MYPSHMNNITKNKWYKHAYSKFYSFGPSWQTVFKHFGTIFNVLLCTDRVFLPGTEAKFFQCTDLKLKEKLDLEYFYNSNSII